MISSVSVVISLLLVIVKSQTFQPIAAGIAADRCFEPVSTGHCRARFPSFHYNPLTETCDCFIFGGCGANGNKFATLDECMNTCGVNPQLQTISSTCVSMFGAESPELTVTPLTISSRPAPLVFSLETNAPAAVTDRNVVIVKASTSAAASVTDATTRAEISPAAPTTVSSSSTNAPTSVVSSTNSPTPASSSTVSSTTESTSTKPAPRKPASTPGPWDHWLNI